MGFMPKSVSQHTPPPAPKEPEVLDKWMLSSNLQKAIRRGHVQEALWSAEMLHQIEPSYLRYRLAVIAVEDVGSGTPSAVIETMGPGWKKAEVEARGGWKVIAHTVERFALSVKDRTPCDLQQATRFLPEWNEAHGPLEKVPWERSAGVALDNKNPWYIRTLAAWRCAGTDRFKMPSILPEVSGDWERWVAVNKEAFGEIPATLMRIGEFQREYHHVFLGISHAAILENSSIMSHPLKHLPKVGPWLSEAMDKHTAFGAKALSKYVKQNQTGVSVLRSYGLEDQEQIDLVGRLWFWKEGSCCNQTSDNSFQKIIHRDSRKKILGSLPEEVLLAHFGQEELWHQARLKVYGFNHVRPAPKR